MPRSKTWRCKRCGSNHYVRASLTGGITVIAQCVPCGRYSGDHVHDIEHADENHEATS